MSLTRRMFLGGLCTCGAGGLLACTPTDPGRPRLDGGLGGQSDLSPRNQPGQRHGTDADPDAGMRETFDGMERRTQTSRYRVRGAKVNAYVGGIVQRMSGEFASDIRTYIIRVPHFNASQAPNGMMQVWTGLLVRCTNEAQMAAVLGHEIGHYTRAHGRERHAVWRRNADLGQALAMLLGAAGAPQAAELNNLLLTASGFGYNRENEREADEIGIRLLAEHGLSPIEAARNWENIAAESEARGLSRNQSLLFSTHPSDDERMANLRRRADELPAGERNAERYRDGISEIREYIFEEQIRTGIHASTIVIADRWLAEFAGDGLALYAKGEALRLRATAGDEEAAATALDAAIRDAHAPANAWRGYGLLRRKLGQEAEARELLNEYLRRAPNAPDRDLVRRSLAG
jgi:beta-barrel assembly-enhancing protease